MGNLYTHIVKKNDTRIAILSKLKVWWQNYKNNKNPKFRKYYMTEIKKLQLQLNSIHPDYLSKENYKKHKNSKKYWSKRYGLFAWKAKQLYRKPC
jgi:hypothetical protein